jgi:hypothetical protein
MPVPAVGLSPFLPGSWTGSALKFQSSAFVRVFKPLQKTFETFGQRLGKIVLRREHASDRRSDRAIAGPDLLPRCARLATHIVLRIWVCLDHVRHPNATGVPRLRSVTTSTLAA